MDISSKLYFYEIGYGSYEDSRFETLTHEQEYTQDQIEDMIADGFKSLYPIACVNQYTEVSDFYNYEEIDIYDWLVKNKGFKKIKYTVTSGIFGWASINKDNWKQATKYDSLYNKIRKAIDGIDYGGSED